MSFSGFQIGQHEIVNRRKAVVGYEFGVTSAKGPLPVGAARMLQDGFRGWATGGLVFLRLDRDAILSGILCDIGSDKIVVEVGRDLHDDVLVLDALREAVRAGVKICLLASTPADLGSPLMGSASFVKVDIRSFGLVNLGRAMPALKGTAATLSARSVDTEREFEACVEAGFVQLQGGYISACVDSGAKADLPNIATLLDLINKVGRSEDVDALENSFKRDAALSYRLFKQVNSVAYGLDKKIQSVRHAISVMGYDKLYRWLVVLMATSVSGVPAYSVALRRCITRARLMELLGEKRLGREAADRLFVAGMFSMVDVLLGVPLEDLIRQLPLDDEVEEAVLRGEGPCAPYLRLAIACETNDSTTIRALQNELSLEDAGFATARIAAIAWAGEVAGIS